MREYTHRTILPLTDLQLVTPILLEHSLDGLTFSKISSDTVMVVIETKSTKVRIKKELEVAMKRR